MNASLSLSAIIAPINRFFSRYHATIFFTIIVLLLAGAILNLYLTIQSPAAVDANSATISSSFDQETADKIQRLRESTESSGNFALPKTRANPFIE